MTTRPEQFMSKNIERRLNKLEAIRDFVEEVTLAELVLASYKIGEGFEMDPDFERRSENSTLCKLIAESTYERS
jgi:hypothetical protein